MGKILTDILVTENNDPMGIVILSALHFFTVVGNSHSCLEQGGKKFLGLILGKLFPYLRNRNI